MELPFLLMDKLQAARLRDETLGDDNRLDPREITQAGPHKGKYALPARILDDPAFAERRDALLMLDEVVLDGATAFFVPDEE